MTSVKNDRIALLATRSDSLAAGMSALLLSIPPIRQVQIRDNVEAMVEQPDAADAALIVVDTSLIDVGATQQMRAFRDHNPQSLVVFLTENMSDYRRLETTTQDTLVMLGTDPMELAGRLEKLLKAHNVS